MLNLQDTIENLLRATKREHLEELLTIMRENEFYRRSCRGHHHWPGGLAQHSLEVMSRMQRQNTQELPIDSIVIVALLHQLYKVSGFKQYHHFGSRSVLIATREAGLRLTPMEYKAILWHMHGPREKGKIGADFDAVLDNPLWQLLRKADHYSCTHPMTKKEFEYAMGGKVRKRNIDKDVEFVMPSHGHALTIPKDQIKPTKELLPEEKRNHYIRQKNMPIARIVELLSMNGIKVPEDIQDRISNELKRETKQDNITGFRPSYLQTATWDEIAYHRSMLFELCQMKEPIRVARYIYDNYRVFNVNEKFQSMYNWLKEQFGFTTELNSFSHSCARVDNYKNRYKYCDSFLTLGHQ